MRYGPRGKSGKLYSPSLPVFVVRENPVSVFVMLTSAPAAAAPCASVTAPRTAAVVTCARAVKAAQRTSPRTASSEKIARDLHIDSFKFKNRIFIRLPLEEIFAREKEHDIRRKQNCLGLMFSFTPPHNQERTQPLKHYW